MARVTGVAPPKAAHCESCGSTDRQDLAGGDGYTSCCNQLVCDGSFIDTYGTETVNVRACCWSAANAAGVTEGWRHH